MTEGQNLGNLGNNNKSIPRMTTLKTTKNSSNISDKCERQRSVNRVKFKEIGCGEIVRRNKSVQFVRNTERPIRATKSAVTFTPCFQTELNNISRVEHPEATVVENQRIGINLDAPELCTSLKFADKLLEKAVEEGKSVYNETSSSAIKKVMNNINIPFEEQVYKNLVDLHVTEEDLFAVAERRFVPKPIIRNKDKEPELSDFYQPTYDEEFIVRPDKLKVEPEKIICYDGFSISDRMKKWKT